MKALELFLADSRLRDVICARCESGYEELRLWLPLPFNGQSGLSGVGKASPLRLLLRMDGGVASKALTG
jgi:hypothetical protein